MRLNSLILTIVTKISILDVSGNPEYTSAVLLVLAK